MVWGAVGAAAIGAGASIYSANKAADSGRMVDGVAGPLTAYWERTLADQKKLETPEYYQGDQIAGVNDNLANSWSGMGSWGTTGAGRGAETALYNVGNQNLNMTNPYLQAGADFLGNLSSGGGGYSGMSSFKGGEASDYQYDQNAFDAAYGNLEPGVAGAQDAATTDIYRQLGEQQLTGINAAASQGGSGFGSKAFNTGSIAARGAMDRAADINAQYDMNARNQGNAAGYGAGINTQNANTAVTNANTSAAASRANAASAAGASRHNALLNAYTQLGNQGIMAGRLGLDQMNAGTAIDRIGMGMQNQAGTDQLGYDQALIDAEMAKWNYEQNAPWIDAEKRLGLIPGGGGGGSVAPGGSSNLFGAALGGIETGLGIYGMGKDQGWWGNSAPAGGYDPMGGGTSAADYSGSNLIDWG